MSKSDYPIHHDKKSNYLEIHYGNSGLGEKRARSLATKLGLHHQFIVNEDGTSSRWNSIALSILQGNVKFNRWTCIAIRYKPGKCDPTVLYAFTNEMEMHLGKALS